MPAWPGSSYCAYSDRAEAADTMQWNVHAGVGDHGNDRRTWLDARDLPGAESQRGWMIGVEATAVIQPIGD